MDSLQTRREEGIGSLVKIKRSKQIIFKFTKSKHLKVHFPLKMFDNVILILSKSNGRVINVPKLLLFRIHLCEKTKLFIYSKYRASNFKYPRIHKLKICYTLRVKKVIPHIF